jgi:hypothetical protein
MEIKLRKYFLKKMKNWIVLNNKMILILNLKIVIKKITQLNISIENKCPKMKIKTYNY